MAHFTINMFWESLLMYSPHLLLELILHHFWTVLPKVTSKTLYESSKIYGFNDKSVCTWEYYSTLLAFLVFMCVCVLLCVVVLSLSGDGWCHRGHETAKCLLLMLLVLSRANKAHKHSEHSSHLCHAIDRQYFFLSTKHALYHSVFTAVFEMYCLLLISSCFAGLTAWLYII